MTKDNAPHHGVQPGLEMRETPHFLHHFHYILVEAGQQEETENRLFFFLLQKAQTKSRHFFPSSCFS